MQNGKLAALIMTLLPLILAACGGGDGSTPAPGSQAAVPNVEGLTQAAARTAITGAGLVVGTVTMASSPTVPAGSVISESPATTINVAPGSAVNLTLSSGPAQVAVPNVVGLTEAAATTAISGAGLTVGTITTPSSATVAVDLVISESSAAGTMVPSGSAVSLVVSDGPYSNLEGRQVETYILPSSLYVNTNAPAQCTPYTFNPNMAFGFSLSCPPSVAPPSGIGAPSGPSTPLPMSGISYEIVGSGASEVITPGGFCSGGIQATGQLILKTTFNSYAFPITSSTLVQYTYASQHLPQIVSSPQLTAYSVLQYQLTANPSQFGGVATGSTASGGAGAVNIVFAGSISESGPTTLDLCVFSVGTITNPPPPSAPMVDAQIVAGGIQVAWDLSTDVGGPGVAGYYIYLLAPNQAITPAATVMASSVPAGWNSDYITVGPVNPGTTYEAYVVAFDTVTPNPTLSGAKAVSIQTPPGTSSGGGGGSGSPGGGSGVGGSGIACPSGSSCVSPLSPSCVSSVINSNDFYIYYWVNNCSQAIFMTYTENGGGGLSASISAGGNASTGTIATTPPTSFLYVVCPSGYYPLNEHNQVPGNINPGDVFICVSD
jgi:hypothetical protein